MKRSCAFLLALALCPAALGAVGCTLTEPDRDVRRLFPQATGYRTEFITIKERGGNMLARRVEALLADRLDPVYESMDVPYAYYIVLKDTEVIGRVHGVNQKGMFGGMQLILATDLGGRVKGFYYQKLTSPDARRFRAIEFTEQFQGIQLSDFLAHDKLSDDQKPTSKVGAILDPSKRSAADFHATLRGIRKNLVLLKLFKLDTQNTRQMEDIP